MKRRNEDVSQHRQLSEAEQVGQMWLQMRATKQDCWKVLKILQRHKQLSLSLQHQGRLIN